MSADETAAQQIAEQPELLLRKTRRASRRPPSAGHHTRVPRGRTRVVLIAVVVVVAVGGGLLGWALSGDSDTSVSARLVAAGVGQIRQTVSATGTVEPTQQANLSFAVSGEVTAVKVAVGDKVQAGQTLATIDSAALATAAAQAKATTRRRSPPTRRRG